MNIINYRKWDKIGEPPWYYDFLSNLPESEYPKYLAKLFKLNTGEELPLKNGIINKNKLMTFNQKIQYIKLYGITDLMRACTDKAKVREYTANKIGSEYLKPLFQIISANAVNKSNKINYFNKIDFKKLPDSFVIKTNHGCKWQFIIKNKNEFK